LKCLLLFIFFVNKLFYFSGYHESYKVQQDYYSVKNFVLIPGHPSYLSNYDEDECQIYKDDHIEGKKHLSQVYGSAWEVARDIITEVYQFFSFESFQIPLFKELQGFPFSFDYMGFYARYKYLKNKIIVEILDSKVNKKWSCEFPIDKYPDEKRLLGMGFVLIKM